MGSLLNGGGVLEVGDAEKAFFASLFTSKTYCVYTFLVETV